MENIQDVLVDVKCRNVKELKSFLESMNKCAVYNLIVDFSGKELSDLIGNSVNISKVTFTDKVENIDNFSLECCNNVFWVKLPKKLKSIGDYAFYGCESLRDIRIEDTVNSIGEGAFTGCINLKELRLPKINTPSNFIDDCRSLKTLILPSKKYLTESFLWNLRLSGCKKLKNFVFEDEKI